MTMTNAEWMIKNGFKFSDVHVWYSCSKSGEFVVRIKEEKIDTFKSKIEFTETDEAFKEWLDMEHKEYKEPILDDAERQYLSAVVKPFRCKIKGIEKQRNWSNSSERIYFHVKKGDMFYLLDFKLGTMYKGMKLNRKYTLEELGL